MSPVGIAVVVVLGLGLLAVLLAWSNRKGYEQGMVRGRQEEQRKFNHFVSELRQQGRAAQRDIDYLYERARGQLQDPG
jgi:hypothetical protein